MLFEGLGWLFFGDNRFGLLEIVFLVMGDNRVLLTQPDILLLALYFANFPISDGILGNGVGLSFLSEP
jgi:hypothetical protein